MKNLLTFFLLSCFILSASADYDRKMAKNMAYLSASTMSTESEINSWTCQYCSLYKLQNTKVFSNPILDVFGYSGYSSADNAIVVAFRSTVSVQNWIVNVDANQVTYPGCQGCLVHQGFYNAFQGVQGYIRSDVQKLLTLHSGAKIFVTGFSLGSALAVIGALDIRSYFNHVDQFYSFGQPRVGNQLFADFFTKQITQHYRVIHYADIVPHLPPQVPLPYSHFASQIWYDQNMKTYKTCGAQEFKCSKSLLPFQWSTSDHDITKYILINVAQPLKDIQETKLFKNLRNVKKIMPKLILS